MDGEPQLIMPVKGKYYLACPALQLIAGKREPSLVISSPLPYQASDLLLFGGTLHLISDTYRPGFFFDDYFLDNQFKQLIQEAEEKSKSSDAYFFSLEDFNYTINPNYSGSFSRITGHPSGYIVHLEAQLQRYFLNDRQLSFKF